MNRLTISDFVNYFEPRLNELVYSLQQEGVLRPDEYDDNGDLIQHPYNFVFFTDSGKYHNKIKEPNQYQDNKYPDILVLIKDGGGGQDVTSSVEVYLQVLSFEVYAHDDKSDEYKNLREDVELIFSQFVQNYKLVTDNYMNNALKIEADSYPTYGATMDNKRFITTFSIDVTMLFHCKLANNDVILINGVEVPYLNFTTMRTTTTTTSLERMPESKYLINKSNYKVTINLLYSDNTVIDNLVNQCDTNESFEQIYSFSIVRDHVTINNYNMILQSIVVSRAFGSVIAIQVQFVPAYIME